jgi:hypothetical protein
MTNPPAGVAYDISTVLKNDTFPNFVFLRVGAHALQTAGICDLHNHNLAGTLEYLKSLEGFVELGKNDPGLSCLMIRVEVLGMTTELVWDALQAEGWNEDQLRNLQDLWYQHQDLLTQLPRAMESERLLRLNNIDWFRSHTYEKVIERYVDIFRSFAIPDKEIDRIAGPRAWRRWVFHPLWSFAWADQEKLQFLKDRQNDMTAARDVVQHCSLLRLGEDFATNKASYHAPLGSWRFYRRLPLHEDFPGPDWRPLSAGEYPYTEYERAWSTTLRNLTLSEMALTAIAIKRYELRHGEEPSSLSELTPELLSTVPRDFMDGKPLRYIRRTKGRFTLYSIGSDFCDNGGDPAQEDSAIHRKTLSPWTGKDWVWP